MALDRATFAAFAAALKRHRARLGITQAWAAKLCRVSLRAWAGWESATGGAPAYPTMRGVLAILGEITDDTATPTPRGRGAAGPCRAAL